MIAMARYNAQRAAWNFLVMYLAYFLVLRTGAALFLPFDNLRFSHIDIHLAVGVQFLRRSIQALAKPCRTLSCYLFIHLLNDYGIQTDFHDILRVNRLINYRGSSYHKR